MKHLSLYPILLFIVFFSDKGFSQSYLVLPNSNDMVEVMLYEGKELVGQYRGLRDRFDNL